MRHAGVQRQLVSIATARCARPRSECAVFRA
jgi:hypothetical protein